MATITQNPHVISWVNPTQNTDGSALAATGIAGYELSIDGAPAVGLPLTAEATSFDMSTLASFDALKSGAHSVTLAVVSTAGAVGAPSTAASFSLNPVPGQPTGVAVK